MQLHMEKFYLTTAIDYVNSRPHLGTAYEKVTADVIARFKRLAGYDTHFVMGNDEHSLNVFKKAEELGIEPLAYCDKMEKEFKDVWKQLDISFDDFIRTTEPRHKTTVQALLRRLHDAGDVFEGSYEGWYCNSCEEFKLEKDLVDGNCPLHHTKAEWLEERNHFFKLSKYQEPLLEHYRNNPDFLVPETRRNEVLRMIESGLKDLSISRESQRWGIPVPFPASFDEGSVVYVWVDALINYLSAVGYGQGGASEAMYSKWWPADLHIIGKDITKFHCIYWPAMLMSAGVALPRQIVGHGFVNFKGAKMSKTEGTAVDPLDAAKRFGPDPLRLYLVREIIYGQDGDFSWERFENRYNADLANNLGNLVSRITSMSEKYLDSLLEPPAKSGKLRQIVEDAAKKYHDAMESLALSDGASQAFAIVDAVNDFITKSEPWALAKNPDARETLAEVLYDSAEATRIAAILLLPVMPGSATEILRRLGASPGNFAETTLWGAGNALRTEKSLPLWPRLEANR